MFLLSENVDARCAHKMCMKVCLHEVRSYMQKSIRPSSFTHVATAFSSDSMLRTSTAPSPMTLLPDLAVAMSLAMPSVFSTFRPTMQALAPRWTSARTWAEQMLPLPPVQKTTLSSRDTISIQSMLELCIVRDTIVVVLRTQAWKL